MKQFLLKCLVLAVVFTMAGCSNDLDEQNFAPETKSLSYLELANNLWDSFEGSVTRSTTAVDANIYPMYYGGMYVQNDKLVVLVRENNTSVRENLIKRCGGAGFEMINCDYSFVELRDIVQKVIKSLQNTNELNIVGCALLDKENKIEVWLDDCSQQSIDKFKAVIGDYSCFTFKTSNPVQFEESIYSGSSIGVKNGVTNGWGSLAYRARRNGAEGFVGSGHVMKYVGNALYNDNHSTVIGDCIASNIGGTVDASFCTLRSGYTPSNQVRNNFFTLSTTTKFPLVGEIVNIAGRHNNGSGHVVSTYVIYNGYTGAVMSGGIAADYASKDGDSGAVIYDNSGRLVGVHVGKVDVGGTLRAISCPAADVNSVLNLVLY